MCVWGGGIVLTVNFDVEEPSLLWVAPFPTHVLLDYIRWKRVSMHRLLFLSVLDCGYSMANWFGVPVLTSPH